MKLVVDASVVCKWLVAENDSEAAVEILAGGHDFFAPDLIVPEVCNVAVTKLRRGEITAKQAALLVEHVPDFFDGIVPSAELSRRAFVMANEVMHPAYDCFYLALAEARNANLVTADVRFLERLKSTQWSHIASHMNAFHKPT